MYNYFELKGDDYAVKFNQEPFTFKHSLDGCKLLSLANLSELILRLPETQVFFSSGDVDITANLDTAHKLHKPNMSLEEAFDNIETSGAFVMVREPESNPVFRGLFNDLTEDVKRFANKIDPGLEGFKLYLFIAAPNSVTPFHIDRYSTFLFQIQGHKDVNVWNPWNKSLVSDIDLEKFFSFKKGFAPELKEHYLDKATVNHIHPGEAIHIPFVAPHWIKNSNEVSVSLSIIFNSRKTTNIADSLRFNNWYRKKFRKPAQPVNISSFNDAAKATIYKTYQAISKLGKG